MLTKRIIPCLDIKNGRTVKGTNFVQLRDAGNPIELATMYAEQGADELVFLDISATEEKRKTLLELVTGIARKINIPFTVGGGVSSLEDAKIVIGAGCDKVAVNSAAVYNPQLITQIAREFGSQVLVLAIDAAIENDNWIVFTSGGKKRTELNLFEWAKRGAELGAGEILFTSMNHDGTKKGFALDALKTLCDSTSIPVIASGGAGCVGDFVDLFQQTSVDAGLAASVFHFQEIQIPSLKNELHEQGILVRK